MPSDDVAELLASVAASLPNGGEDRAGQRDMARAVAAAIGTGRHLVVQAGTGTGKSLAYLVAAVDSGRKVVVATATKALQDQLAQKDLPALAGVLDRPFSFAVLKGRSNYVCLQRAAEVSGRGVQQDLGAAAPAGGLPDATEPVDSGDADVADVVDPGRLVEQLRAIVAWSERSGTGDRGDLPFEPHPRAWGMVSVGPRECPGAHRCPSGTRCFAERARAHAAEADVVVVNTHLYGAHLASGGTVLPPHEIVVFDEAHELEQVMTASLGVDVSPGRLHALHTASRPLLDAGGATSTDLADVAERLRALLSERTGTRVLRPRPPSPHTGEAQSQGGGPGPGGRDRSFFGLGADDRTPPTDGGPSGPVDDELAALLVLAGSRAERIRTLMTSPVPSARGGSAGGDDGRRLRVLTMAAHLAEDLNRLSAPGDGEVAWIDGTPRSPVLRLSPVDVGPPLAASLWPSVTAVLTSATIPSRVEAQLGLDAFDVDRIDVGSPFDFHTHGLLYVARHLPDRRRPESEPAIHEELAALVEAAGGRTLALFTSYRAMTAAAEALGDRLPYTVLVQGDLPKRRLLEVFSEDETSCLFATLGFWQGVDVPGRSLSLVTLDRLPFGRPDDPLLEARRERAGDAAFALVDLPRAASLLAQGVGRLIRSATDYGVVAVLDSRLATAGYRRVLLAALPPLRRTVDHDEVADFLVEVLRQRQPA